MATLTTVTTALSERFRDEVATPRSLQTQYDNQQMTPPQDSAWARFEVLPGSSNQVSAGNQRRWRTQGVAIATIFSPLGAGWSVLQGHVDAVVAAFRGVTASGITLRAPSVTMTGVTSDDRWWQVSIACPFYTDEIDTTP